MNRKLKKRIIIGFALITTILISLWYLNVFDSNNPLDANTEKVQLELIIKPIDGSTLANDSALFSDFIMTYPNISEVLTNNYRRANDQDTTPTQVWRSFFKQKYVKETKKEITLVFPNYTSQSQQITEAYKRLKHHFPGKEYPKKIIFANTNFGGNVLLEDGVVLVGIERYIGGNKNVIRNSLPPDEFPLWLKTGFEKRFLLRDLLMSTVISNGTIPKSKHDYLISEMVKWGKICVITEMALRIGNKDIQPEIVLRWTKDQYNWANGYEKAFWNYLKKNNLMFSTDEKNHAFLLNNGPYTIGFSEESPDRMGQYIGWKMVRNYIFDEELSLSEMIRLDYKKFYDKYKP